MNGLHRSLAPISDAAWSQIGIEATRSLKTALAARKLVDFVGPVGLDASAVSTGRTTRLAQAPRSGVEARLRSVQPLVELRTAFELSREELEAVARGAHDPDLEAVRVAAHEAALAEDGAIFHGFPEAGIRGIVASSTLTKCTISDDYAAYPAAVAETVNRLRDAGVGGPYAIALGPRCYTGLTQSTSSGFPVIEHVRRLLDGPIVWAPGVDGAVVLSTRGGDFELTVGQDFSIGYHDHTATSVHLYLQESFTFRVLSPEAAVPLAYATA